MERVTIFCKGRGSDGQEVLENSIRVVVQVSHPYASKPGDVLVEVNCRFNTGSHKQRCKASHPDLDKVGDGVLCPYSFDFPFVRENNPNWMIPKELIDIITEESGVL
ncbi:MAG: hypothetical protein PHY72_00495 [Candidatus Pacebacteria bacterium]|nr:hypothetical protein [Candidatus Paceibacterota bacterium]